MNREILFRGKQINNGEWVEGYFIETKKPVYRAFIILSIDIDVHSSGMTILDSEIFEVIPETVGRYTGLTDKNGKKIFEGDIFANDFYSAVHGVVKYSIEYNGNPYAYSPCGFIIEWNDKILRSDLPHWCKSDSNASVIGNIHDKSKLLEASK